MTTISFFADPAIKSNASRDKRVYKFFRHILANLSNEYESIEVLTDLDRKDSKIWAIAGIDAAMDTNNIAISAYLATRPINYWDEQKKLQHRVDNTTYVEGGAVELFTSMIDSSNFVIVYSEKCYCYEYAKQKGKTIFILPHI